MSRKLSPEDKIINDSELFFFNSNIDTKTKLNIVMWYNNLSDVDRKYVDILRKEASSEMEYFTKSI